MDQICMTLSSCLTEKSIEKLNNFRISVFDTNSCDKKVFGVGDFLQKVFKIIDECKANQIIEDYKELAKTAPDPIAELIKKNEELLKK